MMYQKDYLAITSFKPQPISLVSTSSFEKEEVSVQLHQIIMVLQNKFKCKVIPSPTSPNQLNTISLNYVKVFITQLCLTLCNPMDCSLPGSSVHGILQARILEWAAISFSRDLPDPGIEPWSTALQADSLLSEPLGKPHINPSAHSHCYQSSHYHLTLEFL